MIDNLLQPDPYKRWPASHALLHPWIRIGSPSHGNEHLSECHENLVRYVNREPPKVFPTDDPANGRDRQRKAKATPSLEHTALVPAREVSGLRAVGVGCLLVTSSLSPCGHVIISHAKWNQRKLFRGQIEGVTGMFLAKP